jgi:hypothetical protein
MRKALVGLLLVSLMLLVIPQTILVQAQPIPGIDEVYYPPLPAETPPTNLTGFRAKAYIVSSSSTYSLQAWFENEKYVQTTNFYRDSQIFLVVSTMCNRWFLYILEYYPPGNVPQAHWITERGGWPYPWSFTTSGVIRIGPFVPEPLEPEGIHTWRVWVYDRDTGDWYTTIIRLNYREKAPPSGEFREISVPLEMTEGETYSLKVEIANTGERDTTFSVDVSGLDVSPPSQTVTVAPGRTQELSFIITPRTTGRFTLSIRLSADGGVLDTRTRDIYVKSSAPAPQPAPQPAPSPTPQPAPAETGGLLIGAMISAAIVILAIAIFYSRRKV